jgi:SAM-dependent methyltransferase
MVFTNAVRWLADIRNRVDYALRQRIRWRRPGLRFENQSKEGLFLSLPEPEKQEFESGAAALVHTYHLAAFRENSSAENFRENLYYLDLLEKAMDASGKSLVGEIEAADIGPSSWFYVQALSALLHWWNCPSERKVNLSGYEADSYRLYADFHSRIDHANVHLRGIEGAVYLPRPFFRQPGRFDLITMLFPFVFIDDALRWGLPASLFQPEVLLADAYASLKPGGLLVIVNQGQKEHEHQRMMMEKESLTISAAYRHQPRFYSYDIERFILVSSREQHNS